VEGKIQVKRITRTLLDWYQKNKILYPWRLTSDPYRIWLSEILLQQTRIPVALPFFQRIVAKYPSLEDVARESQESFVAEWSGIGYYRRARNMHACARELVSNHQQKFPSTYEELTKLPGIGRYTAGALRNVCFDKLTPAIDGNTGRVLARLTLNDLNPTSKEFFVLAYVPLFAGLIVLISDFRSTGLPMGGKTSYVVQALVLLAIYSVMFFAWLKPLLSTHDDPITKFLNFGYPTFDFLLVCVTSVLIRISWVLRGGSLAKAYIALGMSFFLTGVGDLIFAYRPIPAIDMFFFSAYFVLGLAGFYQLRMLRQ